MDFLGFLKIYFIATYQKIAGDPLETLKKNLTKNENFEQSHSAEKCKGGALWAFLTSIQLQNMKKKLKGDPLVTLIFLKKSHIAKNGGGKCLITPKKLERGTLLP